MFKTERQTNTTLEDRLHYAAMHGPVAVSPKPVVAEKAPKAQKPSKAGQASPRMTFAEAAKQPKRPDQPKAKRKESPAFRVVVGRWRSRRQRKKREAARRQAAAQHPVSPAYIVQQGGKSPGKTKSVLT